MNLHMPDCHYTILEVSIEIEQLSVVVTKRFVRKKKRYT